ncbi:hypothetical protein [Azospirillum sp. SYSU D00513]|uniref:hypothetical protein n=1 Tax=Azospirillum sp. SYSU D00513 TaxID=2812561 RepID=UPI001A956ADA|nr:hypothetical protein [Azospirillum sp. SYSU D00513]
MWQIHNEFRLCFGVNQVPIYEKRVWSNHGVVAMKSDGPRRNGAAMLKEEVCALDQYITSIPKELWALARDAWKELADNPFIPILDKDEIARLICSPGFQGYLESERRLRQDTLSCKSLC